MRHGRFRPVWPTPASVSHRPIHLDEDGVWRCTVRRWQSCIIGVVAAGLFGYGAWEIGRSSVSIGQSNGIVGVDLLDVVVVSALTLLAAGALLQTVLVARYRATAEVDPRNGVVRLSERVFRTRHVETEAANVTGRLVYFKALLPGKFGRGLFGPVLCLEARGGTGGAGGLSVCVKWPDDKSKEAEFVRELFELARAMEIPLDSSLRVDRCGI